MEIIIEPWVDEITADKLEAFNVKVYMIGKGDAYLITFKLLWNGKLLRDKIWDAWLTKLEDNVEAKLAVADFDMLNNGTRVPRPDFYVNGRYSVLFAWDPATIKKAVDRGDLVEYP
jgi:hypothetical protein